MGILTTRRETCFLVVLVGLRHSQVVEVEAHVAWLLEKPCKLCHCFLRGLLLNVEELLVLERATFPRVESLASFFHSGHLRSDDLPLFNRLVFGLWLG